MNSTALRARILVSTAFAVLVCLTPNIQAETCQNSTDMDDATRTALTTTGQRYFDMVVKADTASLRQNAIPSIASDFSGIEATIKDNQPALAGSHATARPVFLLDAPGAAPLPRAEFFCGVFGKNGQTSNSAVFYLNNLPPGKYAVTIFDAAGAKGMSAVSFVLQQIGTDWKLGGLYIKALQFAGHDSEWFATRAREYKSKSKLYNAWFYFVEARNLVSPLPFMSTAATDKLFDESQAMQPADVPTETKTIDLPAGGATYKLSAVFPESVGADLELIVKYQASDVSNTNQTYQSNVAVIKAFVAKYPEVRDAFAGVVARAVEPSGRDYGTLLAMKDIK